MAQQSFNKTPATPSSKKYQPISTLNPYQPSWRIKVRVTQKSAMRTYTRDNKENHVFSVNLLDKEGTEIQATMFNQACKKYYPIFEEGSIYYISNARVSIARKNYTHIKNDYSITINENSEVTLVPTITTSSKNDENNSNNSNSNKDETDDNDLIMKQVYKFIKINNMANIEGNNYVDVCGIVKEIKEMSQIISKRTGKSLNKRNILLCDDSNKTIELTLWGDMAQENDEIKLSNNPCIVIKAARINEYNGTKQLSCNSNILINPIDTIKESKTLKEWYDNNGSNTTFEPVTVGSGSSTGGLKVPRYYVSEVKESRIGYNDSILSGLSLTPMRGTGMTPQKQGQLQQNKGSYFSMIGTITSAFDVSKSQGAEKPRLPWYKACTDPNANNAKVTESNDGGYYCAKTNRTYPGYSPRYVTRFSVSDGSGNIWLSAFNDAATMILGTECNVVEKEYNNGNYAKVDKVFKSSLFKQFVFRVRAKSQEYNGEERVRYDLMSVQHIDFAAESEILSQKIEQLKQMMQ